MAPAQLDKMHRLFTIDDANRMLPLLKRIVEDLVRDHRRWQDKVNEFEIATVGSSAERPDAVADLLQEEAQRLARDIEGYVKELSDLGVECKSLESGLIDFPAEIEGRAVYYCWKLDEPTVQYWHPVNEGFAGRQPVVSFRSQHQKQD